MALPAVALQASPAAASSPISVISSSQWMEPLFGGMQVVHIVGQIQNTSGGDVALVKINFTWQNARNIEIGHSFTIATKKVLRNQDYSPFEDIAFVDPALHYDHFVVGAISYSRPIGQPYGLDSALIPCPVTDPPDEVCGSVTNNGVLTVEGVNAILTYLDTTGTTVAQDRWLVDNDLGGSTFAPGDTGHFKGVRVDNHSPVTVVADAEPAYPLEVNPDTLDLGRVNVGTTGQLDVTLYNNGSLPITVNSVQATPSPEFTASTDCPSTGLLAGQACHVTVRLTPTQAGTRPGGLTISDNAAGSPQTIGLTGIGVAPVASIAPPTGLDFGNLAVGTTSVPKPITITNVGTAPLIVTGSTITGDFLRVDPTACVGSLAVNASCVINVAFAPSSQGPRTGSLTLTDNALDSPQHVALTGFGLGNGIVFNPLSLTFDGTAAVSQMAVTVTNSGEVNLTITSVSTDSPFSASGCTPSPLTLAPHATCVVTVTFVAGSVNANGPGMVAGVLHVSGSFGDQYVLLLGNTAAGRSPAQSSGSARATPPPPPPPKT